MKRASHITSVSEIGGGRVAVLLLLFALAIYQFYSAGFSAFAVICMVPVMVIVIVLSFKFHMFLFWALLVVNYFVQMRDFPLSGIPTSLPNEALEILLILIAIIDVKEARFERAANMMLFMLIIWCSFCTLEVLNDTCGLGVNIAAWYQGVRMMAYQMMYIFLVFTLYITNPKVLIRYLYVWGGMALFAAFWVWKQKTIGMTPKEDAWLHGPGLSTHIIQGGTLIRYFSIYSDAANFGVGTASTAVAFLIFGITSKIRKHKTFFLVTGLICAWAMFPSGTRTAIACLMAGFAVYMFLSKSLKIAVPVTIVFALFVFFLAFTRIGQGNQQIRRMRSAFDKNDASSEQRTINQRTMKRYMSEAPWGIGIGMYGNQVPPTNKYRLMSTIAADSEYVFIWIRTGTVGIIVFLVTTAIMLLGACWIVFFRLQSPSLRGIGAGFCCAMVSQQLGGYGNMVLLQFPNCLVFYGGLSIVYILPIIENEWIEYERVKLVKQEEKKQIKQKNKLAERV